MLVVLVTVKVLLRVYLLMGILLRDLMVADLHPALVAAAVGLPGLGHPCRRQVHLQQFGTLHSQLDGRLDYGGRILGMTHRLR